MAKSFLNNANLSRGLRNNNPGNLVKTKITWDGEIPHAQNTDGHFEQFYELRYGIRALMRDIISDIKDGTTTITQFISKYSPSFENDTAAYIANVANALGLGTHAILDLSEETVLALAKIIVRVENGNDAKHITDQDYNDALNILGIPLKKKNSSNTLMLLLLVLAITIIAYSGYKIYKQ